MKKLARYVIPIVLTVSAILSCGSGGNKATQSGETDNTESRDIIKSVIAVSDSILTAGIADTINLGSINAGDIIEIDAKLFNAGDKPFVVTRIDKTCGCVDLQYPKAPLKPGEYGDMPMTFDAKGLRGIAYKTVIMQTSLNAKQHLLVFKAEVNE